MCTHPARTWTSSPNHRPRSSHVRTSFPCHVIKPLPTPLVQRVPNSSAHRSGVSAGPLARHLPGVSAFSQPSPARLSHGSCRQRLDASSSAGHRNGFRSGFHAGGSCLQGRVPCLPMCGSTQSVAVLYNGIAQLPWCSRQHVHHCGCVPHLAGTFHSRVSASPYHRSFPKMPTCPPDNLLEQSCWRPFFSTYC